MGYVLSVTGLEPCGCLDASPHTGSFASCFTNARILPCCGGQAVVSLLTDSQSDGQHIRSEGDEEMKLKEYKPGTAFNLQERSPHLGTSVFF
jgi:hypothetical protein